MLISSGFRKLMPSILSGAIGVSLCIYGIKGRNSGALLLGSLIFIVSMVIMRRTRQKISCEIKNNNH